LPYACARLLACPDLFSQSASKGARQPCGTKIQKAQKSNAALLRSFARTVRPTCVLANQKSIGYGNRTTFCTLRQKHPAPENRALATKPSNPNASRDNTLQIALAQRGPDFLRIYPPIEFSCALTESAQKVTMMFHMEQSRLKYCHCERTLGANQDGAK
jgi:hypothetical protein